MTSEKDGKDNCYKICGQEFRQLVSGSGNFCIDIIEPIGHKAKQKNKDFLGGDGAYSELLDCFERVGIELRPEIDRYFSKFKENT